jgi:hypothetical protein
MPSVEGEMSAINVFSHLGAVELSDQEQDEADIGADGSRVEPAPVKIINITRAAAHHHCGYLLHLNSFIKPRR